VLDGIDLVLQPGERIAVVGPSGAGKSTLLGLVLRFAEPSAGRLLVDGRDLAEVEPGAWRRRLAWVPQRPLLEPGTVAEAVRLGRADATDDEVETALAAAGLRVSLDGRSETLSAGERRRVALARALLRDAPLLLLDEPTAHLDGASAEAVVDVLAALPRDRSLLVTTHDTRVLRAVDRVLELRDGTLRERGLAVA
jgi:ABC-type transport system involved in cytochrome bd biosynthesis fused ATPase/permease subunit